MPIYKMTDNNGKLIKKDGKQKYRVRINYVDNLGKAKQIDRVAYGSDEAKQLERELNHSVKQEAPAAKMTVNQLFDEYIKAKQYEVRESTLDKNKTVLSYHVLPYLGAVKIDKLTVPVLQDWKQRIEASGLAIRMRKNIYGEFRALLNYGVKMEYLPKNPLLKVGNFKAPLELKKEMDFYTPEEFRKFIMSAREHAEKSTTDISGWHYYVFFCIAFYTGLRKGEIYALQWSDIQDGYLSVSKSLTQKLKGGDKITPPKNKSSIRTIQIPLPLEKILQEHKERCKTIDGFSEDLYICGGVRPIRGTSLENMNIKFAAAVGIKKIRIHDFRHSHASLLANEGINIQEIAKRLGHSDISITMGTYSHLYPKEGERAMNVLNNIEINDSSTNNTKNRVKNV